MSGVIVLVSRRESPDRPWIAEEVTTPNAGADKPDACRFAMRCPHTTPVRVEEAPPLFRIGQLPANACYLHRQAPVLPAERTDEVFAGAGQPV